MSSPFRWSLWLFSIAVVLIIALVDGTKTGQSRVLQPTPSPTPDLNGRWIASGDEPGVGGVAQIAHVGTSVRATFISGGACPGGRRTLYFEGQLQGNILSGRTYTACADKQYVEQCRRPPFIPTTFKATVERNQISGTYRELWDSGYMKDGKLDCPTFKRDPSKDQDAGFSLTRETPLPDPEQPHPAPGAEQQCAGCDINTVKEVQQGKERVKSLYEQALRNSSLRTFSDVQKWVIARASASPDFGSPNRFHVPVAAKFISYSNCPNSGGGAAIPNRNCELNITPVCLPSECEILNQVCREHEEGHISDLRVAFAEFKNGTWTVQRWTSYLNGTSTIRADVTRRIQNEIDLYTGDIELLRSWAAECED